jgi:hypothetical protein
MCFYCVPTRETKMCVCSRLCCRPSHRKEASRIYCKGKGIREALNERGIVKEVADLSVSTKFAADPQGRPSRATVWNAKTYTATCSAETGN